MDRDLCNTYIGFCIFEIGSKTYWTRAGMLSLSTMEIYNLFSSHLCLYLPVIYDNDLGSHLKGI